MDNYPNTEDWEIAFQLYAERPDAALDLARKFVAIKQFLQSQPPDVPLAIETLDDAINVLFPLTRFHKGAHDLYRTYIEGRATRAHESLMESLGVNF